MLWKMTSSKASTDATSGEAEITRRSILVSRKSTTNGRKKRDNETTEAVVAEDRSDLGEPRSGANGSDGAGGGRGNVATDPSSNKKDNNVSSMGKKATASDGCLVQEPESQPTSSNRLAEYLQQDKRQIKVVISHFGSDPKEVIHVEQEEEIPTPASLNDVVVKVQASTVTSRDCFHRRGHCFDLINPTTLPLTPGEDVVGRVVQVGTEVKDFEVGDRVAGLIRTGGNARYTSVPASSLVRVPRTIDSAEAACCVSIYTSAYQCMKCVLKAGEAMSWYKGKKVLVVGSMDGVGQALIQMCVKAHAEVYATAPDCRHAFMRNVLGASPLPESSQEWLRVVQGEMDVVFDGLCEDGLAAAKKALRKDGKLVCFGYSSMLKEEMGYFGVPLSARFNKWRGQLSNAKNIDIWDSFQRDPEMYKKQLASLFQLVKWKRLKPGIAKRVGLSEVAFAHSKLESGYVRGTVVCLPWRRVGSRHIADANEEAREG